MDIKGATRIPASPEMVWDALNDPVVLAQCVAGCDSFEQVGPAEFAATGSVRVGPVRSRIAVNLTISDSERPTRAVLNLAAQGSLGRAQAAATIHLAPSNKGTNLEYEAHAVFGGQLGRLAGRWANGAAQQLVEEFFTRFAAAIPASPVASVPAPAAPAPTVVRPIPRASGQTLSPRTKAVWIGIGAAAGAAVTAAAALLLSRNRER